MGYRVRADVAVPSPFEGAHLAPEPVGGGEGHPIVTRLSTLRTC